MKINKINTKLIKPQNPTPQNLKNYKISFIDQQIGPVKFAVVLFYESKPEDNSQLEESLAKVLVQFYPLAGRYVKNDHLVDCSDQGVEFVEAQALEMKLTDFMANNVETKQLNALLPDQYFGYDNEIVSIQATHFPCGGLAIAISASHAIIDASSLGTFIAAWSNAANPDNKAIESFTPSFDLPSLLPYKNHNISSISDRKIARNEDLSIKRLLFDKVALSKLRENNGTKMISRVRIVCAVLAKALIRLDRTKHGRSRDFVIGQAINLRERTIPPQPKHACGNFSIFSFTRRVTASEATEIGIGELVDMIGDAAEKSIADHVDILSPSRDGRDIIISTFENLYKQSMNRDTNMPCFTDWSKFGFYEADFGWGKPVWTNTGLQQPGITILMSSKEGDGIEAWVQLTNNDMRLFEQDDEVKLFTT